MLAEQGGVQTPGLSFPFFISFKSKVKRQTLACLSTAPGRRTMRQKRARWAPPLTPALPPLDLGALPHPSLSGRPSPRQLPAWPPAPEGTDCSQVASHLNSSYGNPGKPYALGADLHSKRLEPLLLQHPGLTSWSSRHPPPLPRSTRDTEGKHRAD